jgi:hypothetical protein
MRNFRQNALQAAIRIARAGTLATEPEYSYGEGDEESTCGTKRECGARADSGEHNPPTRTCAHESTRCGSRVVAQCKSLVKTDRQIPQRIDESGGEAICLEIHTQERRLFTTHVNIH